MTDINSYLKVYPQYCQLMREKVAVRTYMWNMFSGMVADHVQNYTVNQYGDYPNDNVTNWSRDDCLKQIEKYVKRFYTNARGVDELNKDLLKIAHYCSLAYFKNNNLEKEFDPLLSKEVEEHEVGPTDVHAVREASGASVSGDDGSA